MKRLGWLFWLLASLPVAAQTPPANPQTPREFSRAIAHALQRYDGLCEHHLRWVIAFDISRSGMGQWIEWARQVVYDLVQYVVVEGDTVVMIPFDVHLNPGREELPTWTLTGDNKPEVQSALASLMQYRPDSPDGTAWVDAAVLALQQAAAVESQAPTQRGLALVISDRDSSDDLHDSRSAIEQVPGVSPPGQDLWPLPQTTKPIVVLHSLANWAPSQGSQPATRWIPPFEPPAGAPAPVAAAPVPEPVSRPPGGAWRLGLALLLLGLGAWLIAAGVAAARRVSIQWQAPSSSVHGPTTLTYRVGQRQMLQASTTPSASPHVVVADGATTVVQRKAILEDLGWFEAVASGAVVSTSDSYFVRATPGDWTNQVEVGRGEPPVDLDFRLARESWNLTGEPVRLQVTDQGRHWQAQAIGGGVLAVLGLLILLTARPSEPPPGPPPPTPPAVGQPTEQLCG